jgi:hypothetical protein
MMAGYPFRVGIGVLSVIIFAVLSSGLALRQALDPPRWAIAQDETNHYEARFRLLRSALPPEGVVGYLSESRRSPHDLDWSKGFFLTKYGRSPLVIAPALVIGNGVLLFRHESR